jgi:hypothetical protein
MLTERDASLRPAPLTSKPSYCSCEHNHALGVFPTPLEQERPVFFLGQQQRARHASCTLNACRKRWAAEVF